jgi:hypothetical protein
MLSGTLPPPLVTQVDEPALREGLPLKASKWGAYLGWAVDAFRRVCVWGVGVGGWSCALHRLWPRR